MIWPDHVSCFVWGARLVRTTSTAWNFWFLGGMGQTLYVTSSPSTGTYSPSMLQERRGEVVGLGAKSRTPTLDHPAPRKAPGPPAVPWERKSTSDGGVEDRQSPIPTRRRLPQPSPQVPSPTLMARLPQGVPALHDPRTYSDTWTKMSSVPFSGVMNPWPWERENCLQTPLKMGPAEARAVLWEERDGHISPAARGRGLL